MRRLTSREAADATRPADPSTFTGPARNLAVATTSDAHSVRALLVHFEEGARTHWHSHAGGQVLHVVDGRGRTQARGGEVVELEPGDIVTADPGEEHWHGAAEGVSMSHLAISIGATHWGPAPD